MSDFVPAIGAPARRLSPFVALIGPLRQRGARSSDGGGKPPGLRVGRITAMVILAAAFFSAAPAHAQIGASLVTAGINSTTVTNSFLFPSATYSNNVLYIAFTSASCTPVCTAPTVTGVSGAGLTFTEVGTAGGVLYSASSQRIQAWRALATSGAGTGQVTVALSGNSTGIGAAMIAFTGTRTTGPNGADAVVQSVTATTAGALNLTPTLGAFADSRNRPVAFFSHTANQVTNPEAGYAELFDVSHAGPALGYEAEWNAATAETTPQASWATSTAAGGFALEIAASSFEARKAVTVDFTKVAPCGGSLANFPVLVSLSGNYLKTTSNGGRVYSSSGYDIEFRASDGVTKLDHEIEKYDGTAGALVAWVRVPVLSNVANTTIYLYYANSGITADLSNRTGVWDANYRAVWHLKETGTGAVGEYLDSTTNANNGRGGNGVVAAVPTRVNGALGYGQSFDGSNDFIDAQANASLNVTGPLTLEAWVQFRQSAAATTGAQIVGKGANPQYWLYQDFPPDNNTGTFSVNNPGGPQYALAAGMSLNSWYHLTGVYDNVNASIYLNGTLIQGWPATGALVAEAANHLLMGKSDTNADFFNGPVDEVRISASARSACWIGTEYKNQSSPGNDVTPGFYTVGSEELLGPSLTQGHYRWRNDDGSEATATWNASQDSRVVAMPKATTRRLRFEVSNEGGLAASAQYLLQVGFSNTCSTALYATVGVGTPGQDWQILDSTNFADGAATTNVAGGVTDEAATFVAGQMRDATNPTTAINLAGNQFTEIEFAVRANASAVPGGNYCFRLYDATNNRPLDAYWSYAQATVAYASPMLVRTGSYIGDGSSGRAIAVGFQPDVVIVHTDEAGFAGSERQAVIRTATMAANQSKSLIFYANDPLADRIQSFDPNGFTVGHPSTEDATARITCVNHTGVKYHWTAFRAAAGEMALGTYTGNGTTLDVTGLGFAPDYVIAMPILTGWSQQRSTGMPATNSRDFEGVLWTTSLTTLLADGFRLGNGTDTNSSNELHHYVAWKEVAGRMDVGTYTGTGIDPLNVATVGFLPANVFLSSGYMKPLTTGATVDRSMPFRCFTSCAGTDQIQQLLVNGFQLGGNLGVNTNATPYYWAAFAAPDLEQVHTRWRNDDGSEAAATWAAAEDTAISGVPVASKRRLRFEVASLGGLAADPTAFALQVAETATCATGSYTTVTTGAGAWQIVDSTFLTDAAATTNVAGGLTDVGAFVAGQVKDAGSATGPITLGVGQFTEIEYSLQATASATPGGAYCFRLYDTTASRALDGYPVYAQATLPTLTLADMPAGQIADQFGTATPVTAPLFQFRLSRAGTVTVDNLSVRFTTTGGVVNGDVSAGELWQDTNSSGLLDGGDTLIQGAVTPVAGVLTFTTNFSPPVAGMAYFVRATVANLVAGDTTTLSLAAADIDELESGVGELGTISNAIHTEDSAATGGDIYYSVGTSAADLKTGAPAMTLANGTAVFNIAQTGYIGVGDAINYPGPTTVYIKTVLSPSQFVVQTATGGMPGPFTGFITSVTRAFNTIATAEANSTNAAHLNTANLVTGNFRLTWVCYNDGPFNVAATTTILGYTTDVTHYITLTVAGPTQTANGASHRHDGTAGSGVVVELTAALDPAFDVGQAYTRFEWLEIDGNDRLGSTAIVTSAGGDHALLQYLLLHNLSSTNAATTSNGIGIALASTLGLETIRNSFIYDFDEDGIDANSPGGTIQNVTLFRTRKIANGGEGIQVGGGRSATATNVLSMVNALGSSLSSDFFNGGAFTCNNCISGDATADDFGGASNLVNKAFANQFESTTAGAVDLHLKALADAIGSGTNLSGSFTDDIDGETRSGAWDVGADERLASTGEMLVKSGTYTGDGTDNRAIDVGFQPDVVFVKNESASLNAVLRTATMTGDNAKSLQNAPSLALAANLIQSLDANGFTVGSANDVNQAGQVHHWVAFKAAPGELKLGSYVGIGLTDNRPITGVGFKPEYVITLPANTGVPVNAGSTFPADTSFDFDATQVGPNLIQAFQADGFEIGSDVNVNANGVTYYYVAWNAVPGRTAVGTYQGDGLDNRNLDVVGFFPEWVIVKKFPDGTLERAAMHKPASSGVNTDIGLRFSDTSSITNTIQALRPLGFQVGNDTDRINSATDCGGGPCTYHYVAFGPHTATTNYRSIGTATAYAAGTVAATNGSATVTGTGTSWVAANRGRGDVLTIGGTNYQVLSVDSNTSLTLASMFTGASGSGLAYQIRRQFTTLQGWESCIDGQGGTPPPAAPCFYFPAPTASLIADDRSEVGIAYKDSPLSKVDINGSSTDALHTITLTADPGNRHLGVAGGGVVIDGLSVAIANILVQDDFVTVEWLESKRGLDEGIEFQSLGVSPGPANKCVVRNMLIHDVPKDGIIIDDALATVDVYDNIIYRTGPQAGIRVGTALTTGAVRIFNNTLYGNNGGINGSGSTGSITLRNNLSLSSGSDYNVTAGARNAASSNNISTSATTGTSHSPAGGGINSVVATASPTVCGTSCVGFVNITAFSENLHLITTTYTNQAVDNGASLTSYFTRDIDNQVRPLTAWDVGADERDTATAVKLAAFAAQPFSGAVGVEWETASEIDNLGFHLYRALSDAGPWARLTPSLIAGLGSSPTGRSYTWLDTGLTNGLRYYYRLEDVDTRSKVTSHGPVSAVPDASLSDPTAGTRDTKDEIRDDDSRDDEPGSKSCPAWVLAAYGQSAPSGSAAPRCTRYGKPEEVSLEELQHSSRSAVLELTTGGFYAVQEPDGSVRLFVPGFDTPDDPQAPALPLRRALVEAVAGRTVAMVSAEGRDLLSYRGLTPAAVGVAEIEVSRLGAVRGARRATRPVRFSKDFVPEDVARLASTVFQGETKSAVVELTPLRYDGASGQLVLARRVRVRLSFAKRDFSESGRGRKPPRPPAAPQPPTFALLAQLQTAQRGLHAIAFEQLPAGAAPVAVSELRLQIQGEPVAFHVAPASASFGPGSVLYFHSDRVAASTDFTSELAFELVRSQGGPQLASVSAAPVGAFVSSPSGRAEFEVNAMYVPGLADAPDVWFWDGCVSGGAVTKTFALPGLDPTASRGGELTVYLQGASESGQAVDHHVVLSLGGVPLGEMRFAGKKAIPVTVPVPAGLLQAGVNSLQIQNVADTGVSSAVYLDRFSLAYPQLASLRQGLFEGSWSGSGAVELSGVTGAVALVDVTQAPARWLTGFQLAPPVLRFQAEAGHRYLAVSAEGLLAPRVQAPPASTLRSTTNQADYLLVAPSAFLTAAQPLLDRRQAQGLSTRAVAFEEIAQVFGHGRPSAEAVREFLAYAFQSWSRPSPRYVLLLGDATSDSQHFLSSSRPSPLPALWTRTAFLLTVSDPMLAAVNGEDALPDLAIGRLPATSVEDAQTLVAKLLAWEDSGQGLSGKAALVADNPDSAGDFEANALDIAQSFLAGRDPSLLFLSQLGGAAAARPAIRDAFDSGLSLMSYVGHGASALWATENIWNSRDVLSLRAQSQQPLLLTLNCLNGYFVPPTIDSLAESLVKAGDRGAIAAFAPSGLSLDVPAHQYHRALMAELTSGRHERLGDAILAAQRSYAATGLMPELLQLYHLLGDPALRLGGARGALSAP